MASEWFLKVLAFCLGFKHESPEELRVGGKVIRLEMVFKQISYKLAKSEIESIYRIGAILYSEEELERVKQKLLEGESVHFSFPTSGFDFEDDFINFFCIETKGGKYYILANSDLYDYNLEEEALLLLEVNRDQIKNDLENLGPYYSSTEDLVQS